MSTMTATPGRRYARVLPFGALLATMVSVQFGAAFSKQLFPVLGVERTTFLRLGLGALLLAPILKPWRMRVTRQQWPLLLLYSAVLAGMNLCFYLAVQRIPLGIAVALEFIGPLGLAVCLSHRRMDLLWVALAVIGLSLLLPIGAVFHHADHERLPARHVECVDNPLHRAEREDFRDVDTMRKREPGERQRLRHGQSLRPHQHLAAVNAIDNHARQGRKQKGGNLAGEADGPQQQRRPGQAIDEPRRGHARHPGTDQ